MVQKLVASKKIPRKWIERLDDNPKVIFPDPKLGLQGYQHFVDPTKMPFSMLTFPSVNCTIPSFDKVVPDLGKTLLGQGFTEDSGIDGNKQKFKNLGGIEMEGRAWPSLSDDLGDVIDVGYLNNRLVMTGFVGSFDIYEVLSGQTSGATGIIVAIVGTVLFLSEITGEFEAGEQILGQTSGATATIVLAPEYIFQPITELTNPLPRGLHEYYFDEYFDTNLDPALSKNLPRMVWVNGYRDSSNPVKGAVYSWTGGIGVITSFVANTSISTDPLTTWRSLGFSENANGDVFIVINGVSHQIPVPADIDTDTLNITDTTGMAIGDTVTSQIEVDESPIPFDMCRLNKAHMFYGNWNYRNEYMSNAFNRPDHQSITAFQGGLLNDLVIDGNANPYTGTIESVFHIVIDTVNPEVNTQTFTGTGLNDGYYDTSGYSGTPGVLNTYSVAVLADFTLTCPDGSITGVFEEGESVKGSTSNAEGVIIKVSTAFGSHIFAIQLLTFTSFVNGETVTGAHSGATGTADLTTYQNWIQFSKNGVVIPIDTGLGADTVVNMVTIPITLTDGLTIQFSNFFGHTVGDSFQLTINEGGIDTFQWQKDGGAFSASTPITAGAFQPLSDGVQIKFLNAQGHTVGDYWDITAIPEVTRAWVNFYYALPVRRPGEGYIFRLPSNFWTMDTQEESMYVNGSYGEWGVIDTVLSADLQSETVSYTPLKQTGANKVLYPYLTGHTSDKLVYIDTDHNLNTIGREQFLEKPQTGYWSDPVKLDFDACSFIGGRIKYVNKRLYISSPQDGLMHCLDTFKGYWQPPKTFPEMGLLSIVGNDLVAHSNIRNQSFTVFTNKAGDNGQAYGVEIRTPYTAFGGRWRSKYANQSFVEGYITGNPKLIQSLYLGVGGCGGIFPHDVGPIVCVIPDRAPFGEGSFGSHSFGSDAAVEGSYFNEIYKKYAPVLQYYFISFGLTCIAKSHTWSMLGMAVNGMTSQTGNNALVNKSNLAINNNTDV